LRCAKNNWSAAEFAWSYCERQGLFFVKPQ
jgi:hypothetical protein